MMRRYKILQNDLNEYRVIEMWCHWIPRYASNRFCSLEDAHIWINAQENQYTALRKRKTWTTIADKPAELYQTAARLKGRP